MGVQCWWWRLNPGPRQDTGRSGGRCVSPPGQSAVATTPASTAPGPASSVPDPLSNRNPAMRSGQDASGEPECRHPGGAAVLQRARVLRAAPAGQVGPDAVRGACDVPVWRHAGQASPHARARPLGGRRGVFPAPHRVPGLRRGSAAGIAGRGASRRPRRIPERNAPSLPSGEPSAEAGEGVVCGWRGGWRRRGQEKRRGADLGHGGSEEPRTARCRGHARVHGRPGRTQAASDPHAVRVPPTACRSGRSAYWRAGWARGRWCCRSCGVGRTDTGPRTLASCRGARWTSRSGAPPTMC